MKTDLIQLVWLYSASNRQLLDDEVRIIIDRLPEPEPGDEKMTFRVIEITSPDIDHHNAHE